MVKVPLKGGAYEAKSIIADAQRCVNLYPEKNPEGAAAEFTYYPTPGLSLLAQGPSTVVRGLYTASSNRLYAVIGSSIYLVNTNWTLTLVGLMAGALTTPVSMMDNSQTLMIVDGSTNGYTVDLTTQAFSQIVQPAFYGATAVDYLDSFMILNRPGTKQFYTTLSNSLTFDPLYFASKTSSPDKLATLIVKNRELWLLGERTTEVWYNAGNAAFPFAAMPGTFVENGCAAPYSVAKDGASLFWLTLSDRGQAIAARTDGYQLRKISTYALEAVWASYQTISDAVGYTYQDQGHVFYVLTFPTEDKTWVFDTAEGLWHERAWMDSNGDFHRHRANCHAFAYDTHVVGDFENGRLYRLDPNVYTDNGSAIRRVRSFPHMVAEGKRVIYRQFLADMEVGRADLTGVPPLVELRWSDTRGASYGQPVLQTLGASGQFLTSVQWRRLGTARDRVFELSWSMPYKTALSGAFIDLEVCAT